MLFEDNWANTNEKFVLNHWKWSISNEELNTHRIIDSSDNNILNIYVDETTTFDSGWFYIATEDELFYVYDNYLARSTEIENINDILI